MHKYIFALAFAGFSLMVPHVHGATIGTPPPVTPQGTVAAIDGSRSTFTIKQTDGKSVVVMTDKFTKFLKNEKPATGAELKVGVRVVVDAKMDSTAKMFVAEEVRVGVASPAPAAAKGPATTQASPQKAPAAAKK